MEKTKRRDLIDPAVADILTGMERKERIASLPRYRQEKRRRDWRRYKVTLDFPEELHNQLKIIATKEGISISGLVAFFAVRGTRAYQAGEVDLGQYKRISRCARFDYVLNLGDSGKD